MTPTTRRIFLRFRNRAEWWATAAMVVGAGIVCWGLAS
jgi:hypothetical protein